MSITEQWDRTWMKIRRWINGVHWTLSTSSGINRYIARHLHLDGYYWLFLLGVNNSGTTLLTRMLESHPQIRSLPHEGQRYTRALAKPGQFGAVRLWGTQMEAFRLTETDAPDIARRCRFDWAHAYEHRPGVILEKSPPNTVRSRWLQAHFRPCRFIAIVRNPYAVCQGIRRRQGHDIEAAATHWARSNGCLLDDLPRLERAQLITYEALCDDPERTLDQINRLLALESPLDAGVFGKQYDVHNINDEAQPIRNLNDHAISQLSGQEIDQIDAIVGNVARKFGYEKPAPA